jgi:hypothetical protein
VKVQFLLQFSVAGLAMIAGLNSSLASSLVPRTCIEHAISTSFGVVGETSSMLASCPDPAGEPVRGGKKVLSEKLVSEITTDFNVIADCLDLNAKFYFPKITGESGFQLNTFGPKGDGGIGQLTRTAIDSVNEALPNYLYRIHRSERKSCQILTQLLKTKLHNQVRADSDISHRCELMNAGQNPLRNLLYTMILNDLNRRAVNNAFRSRDISTKLIMVGVAMSSDELEQLKSLLAMMGYNMGGSNAVQDLSNYLDARLDFIQRKAKELPASMAGAASFGLLEPGVHQFLKMVNIDDLDIVAGLERYKNLRKPYYEQLKLQNLLDEQKAQEQYDHWLRNISASELSFSEWLWVWQKSRGIAYINMINNIKNRMDTEMGAGVCTADDMNRDQRSVP